MGYLAAGFGVVGVDIVDQPDYPLAFLRADALTVDLSGELAGFDVIAASPPCQRWCRATPTDRRREHPDLLDPIRRRLRDAVAAPGEPSAYVIENVPGAPLDKPVTVCGDTLRLGVRRHRLFESNVPLLGTPCWHDRLAPPVPVYGAYNQRGRATNTAGVPTEQARQATGVDWMPWPALTQAIPPAYTYWLGVQLLTSGHLRPADVDTDSDVLLSHGSGSSVTPVDGVPSHDRGRSVTLVDGETSHELRASFTTPTDHGRRSCHCGRPLSRPATGRWPRYCSQACRQAAYRARHRGST